MNNQLSPLNYCSPLSDEQFRAMLADTKKQATDEVVLLLDDSSNRMPFLLASLSGELTSLIEAISHEKGSIFINANIVKLGEILNLIKRTVETAEAHPQHIFYGLEKTKELLHTLLDPNEDKSDLPDTLNLYTKGTLDDERFLGYLRTYLQFTFDACKQTIGEKTLSKVA